MRFRRGRADELHAEVAALTDRESEVVRLVACEMSLRDRAQIAVLAYESGLVRPGAN